MTDEATASIDLVTEEKIQKAFSVNFKNSTIITIAHRIRTVSNYDKILVLDKGKVIEFGPPAELLKNPNGIFFLLHHSSVKWCQIINKLIEIWFNMKFISKL